MIDNILGGVGKSDDEGGEGNLWEGWDGWEEERGRRRDSGV